MANEDSRFAADGDVDVVGLNDVTDKRCETPVLFFSKQLIAYGVYPSLMEWMCKL